MIQQNRYFVIVLCALSFFITSCSLEPVEIKELGNIDVQNISNNVITIKVAATINNPNTRLTVKNSEVFVYMKDKELGKITQLEKLTIEGKTTKKYSTLLKLELTGLKANPLTLMSLFNGKKQDLKLTGRAKITTPFYWKRLKIKDYPVKL